MWQRDNEGHHFERIREELVVAGLLTSFNVIHDSYRSLLNILSIHSSKTEKTGFAQQGKATEGASPLGEDRATFIFQKS